MQDDSRIARILNAKILRPDNRNSLFTIEIRRSRIAGIRQQRKMIEESSKHELDARGYLVFSGLTDHHTHLFAFAAEKRILDLRSCQSISELQAKVGSLVSARDNIRERWVIGRGWNQELFEEKRFPTRHDLDSVSGERLIFLERICGHVGVVNSKAIQEAKFSLDSFKDDVAPRLSDGSLSGIVKESVLDLFRSLVPPLPTSSLRRDFLRAQDEVISKGLVRVHCVLSEGWKRELNAIRRLDGSNQLVFHVYLLLPVSAMSEFEKMRPSFRRRLSKGNRYEIIGFKLYTDGSLGARTAALNEEYSDDPGNYGILNNHRNEIAEFATRSKRLGMILACHAIGDRAIKEVIEGYRKAKVSKSDQFRIEHCSLVRKEFLGDLRKFVISVQPSFSTSDYWINERLGERKTVIAYPLRTLSEITDLLGGSDAPVEDLSPFTGINSAIQNPNKSESLDLLSSIKLYRSGADEIKRGNSANLILLNTSDLQKISETEVELVVIDGIVAFRKSKAA